MMVNMPKWKLLQFFLCLRVFCVHIVAVDAQSDYVGTPCGSTDLWGVCQYVMDCPMAIQSIRKTHRHNLVRCGFDGSYEIVCCPKVTAKQPTYEPDDDDNDDGGVKDGGTDKHTNRFPKRKCEQVCDEISNEISREPEFHIIGGTNALQNEFPHMVALGYESDDKYEWNCGATLISEDFLLTAAHCLTGGTRPVVARMGVTRLDERKALDVPIRRTKIHPQYSTETKHNDIALIELAKSISTSDSLRPACLYTAPDDPRGLQVTGWGKTSIGSEDDRTTVLQKAILIATSLQQCNETYSRRSGGLKTIDNTQLCAAANHTDSCWGDSGGPLQVRMKSGPYAIVGVISYGSGCGGKIPGVYTRVSKYLDWIENIVWP